MRTFDPPTGRYLQPDPSGFNGGIGLYVYGLNSPLMYIDPTGRNTAAVWGGFWEGAEAGAEAGAETGAEVGAEGGTFVEPGGGTVLGGVGGGVVGGVVFGIAGGVAGAWAAYSKGGTQNIENEYSREARRQPDPCGWLEEQYAAARSVGDAVATQKIIKAQKALGCRNKQKRCGQ